MESRIQILNEVCAVPGIQGSFGLMAMAGKVYITKQNPEEDRFKTQNEEDYFMEREHFMEVFRPGYMERFCNRKKEMEWLGLF